MGIKINSTYSSGQRIAFTAKAPKIRIKVLKSEYKDFAQETVKDPHAKNVARYAMLLPGR